MSVKRILFVCTGNSCRSVMAEQLLQHLCRQAGIQEVAVESAGAFAIPGMLPTRETQQVLQASGVKCADYRARLLTPEMIAAADLILVMEPFHKEEVLRRVPSARGKTHLLKSYGLTREGMGDNPAIPDPIGKPLEVYEVCFAQIREAVERVATSINVPRS